eukprot:TRINITY_DN6066_c0_g1_i1.p1 TRINITY_DN6066_c0_g1~~TRINITY_DN6066_c0_g1_i1.p1  ORF type:complete len:343 (-),score=49.19 TRINITY_DN6066_c0_g1_i1:68-1096(-)
MEGMLAKQNPAGKWQPRFFALRGFELSYAEEQGGKPKGIIDLRDAVITCHGVADFSIEGPHVKRKFELSCSTGKERETWVTALNKATGRPQEAPKHTAPEPPKPAQKPAAPVAAPVPAAPPVSQPTPTPAPSPATAAALLEKDAVPMPAPIVHQKSAPELIHAHDEATGSAPKPAPKKGTGVLSSGCKGEWQDKLPSPKAVLRAGPPPDPQIDKFAACYGIPGDLEFLGWRTYKIKGRTVGAERGWYHIWFYLKEDQMLEVDLEVIIKARNYLALMSKMNDQILENVVPKGLEIPGATLTHMVHYTHEEPGNKFPGKFLVVSPPSGAEHIVRTFNAEVLENE